MNFLYQEIETLRCRPGMHIGKISITVLRDYLVGFQAALVATGCHAAENLLPLPFWFFHVYVANHYEWYESTAGWKNIILEEVGQDEEKGFWTFFELFDEFKKLLIQRCWVSTLSEENIRYHHTDSRAWLLSPDFEKKEPLYVDPVEVFIIELTGNAGFLCMVNTTSQHRLERGVFKSKREADRYVEWCFGRVADWRMVDVHNMAFGKDFVC